MTTSCSICRIRYALAQPQPDKTGLAVFMCIECAATNCRPRSFPSGTSPGAPGFAQSDFLDDERSALTRELELRTAQAERLVEVLRNLLVSFPELRTSLSSAPQQQVLREARALLAEVGL